MSKESVDRVRELYRVARRGNPRDLFDLLAPGVTWRGAEGTRWQACENAQEVAQTLLWRGAANRLRVAETIDVGDRVVVGLRGARLYRLGAPWWAAKLFQVVTVRDGRITGIQDFGRREQALAEVGLRG